MPTPSETLSTSGGQSPRRLRLHQPRARTHVAADSEMSTEGSVVATPHASRLRESPAFLLALLLLTVLASEFVVMLALARFAPSSISVYALLDAVVVTVLMFPVLLLLVVRPMRQQIAKRTATEAVLRKTINALEAASAEARSLRGLLPICASCKRIRDTQGQWDRLEHYIEAHSDASFTHSICPECTRVLYPGLGARRTPKPPTEVKREDSDKKQAG